MLPAIGAICRLLPSRRLSFAVKLAKNRANVEKGYCRQAKAMAFRFFYIPGIQLWLRYCDTGNRYGTSASGCRDPEVPFNAVLDESATLCIWQDGIIQCQVKGSEKDPFTRSFFDYFIDSNLS